MAEQRQSLNDELAVFIFETVAMSVYVLLLSAAGAFLAIYALSHFSELGSSARETRDGWRGVFLLVSTLFGFAAAFMVGCVTAKPVVRKIRSFVDERRSIRSGKMNG